MKYLATLFIFLLSLGVQGQNPTATSHSLSGTPTEMVSGGLGLKIFPGGEYLYVDPTRTPGCVRLKNNSKDRVMFVPLRLRDWNSFVSKRQGAGVLQIDANDDYCSNAN